MLTEDTRLWVRHKGWFLTHSNSNKQNIILFWCQFSKIQFSQDGVPTASGCFHVHWVLLQEKNSELKNSKSFNLACKQNCPIFSHTEILSLLYWTVNKPDLCCSRRNDLGLPRLSAMPMSFKCSMKWKDNYCICSQNRQKCERNMENSLTT